MTQTDRKKSRVWLFEVEPQPVLLLAAKKGSCSRAMFSVAAQSPQIIVGGRANLTFAFLKSLFFFG